ncbi:MAG: uracil-DNA glycosylase [Oscillospiraceae bacterium]|jgi:DNA polymerase|nr:uracil-DNA glycosylase [Oscillospiraceae bacterium]
MNDGTDAGISPETTWEELESACLSCKKCALYETRTKLVFGVGNREAEIMFVGEGPGEHEDMTGEPFVGRAGKLLDEMLEIIDLSRGKNVYIANIVKCRPPANRDPLNTERDACIDWLRAQYRLIRPKIVVCLGRISAGELIGDADFKISRDHGRWYDKDGVRFISLYHPAALLRDQSRRPDTFVDLKSIQREIRKICERTY